MNKRFEALDAFRGLAALLVVAFHVRLSGSVTELTFVRSSHIFVEFFFVLSGFVLVHAYGFRENLNFSRFIKARFFRIYPLHLAMFVVVCLLEVVKLIAYQQGGFSFNHPPFTGSYAIGEILPNLLLIQSWFSFADPLSFNYPTWSISIEFYLYVLLFPTIDFLTKFKKILWIMMVGIAFYLLVSKVNIFVNEVLRGVSCFFGGALTNLLYRKIHHIKLTKIYGSLLEVMVLVAVVIVVQSSFKYHTIVATLLFYLVVLVFAFESGVVSSYLKLKWFQMLGKLSYSIYMIHAAILFCFISSLMVLQKLTGLELTTMKGNVRFLTSGNELLNNLLLLLLLSFIVWLSQYTYKYIELKGQQLGRPS
ncbi:MAG: acyltransferase [Methylococcales bacterium]|nr:acyltransferase [Methylococcales bacterium]